MSALDSADMSLIYADRYYLTTSDTDKQSALFRVCWFLCEQSVSYGAEQVGVPVKSDKCYAPKTIVQTWQGFLTTLNRSSRTV